MSVMEIVKAGAPVLKEICAPVERVNKELRQLLDDMAETMYKNDGVGLAAPQVTYLMHDLASRGLAVDTSATTVKEAAKAIAEALRRS